MHFMHLVLSWSVLGGGSAQQEQGPLEYGMMHQGSFLWLACGVYAWCVRVSMSCEWILVWVSAPVILSSFDKLSKVSFYPLVHTFWLSISAWVVRSAEVLLYFQRFTDRLGEVWCESGISIWYNPFWYTKPGEEVLEIELRYALTVYGLFARQELRGFGTSLIHYG